MGASFSGGSFSNMVIRNNLWLWGSGFYGVGSFSNVLIDHNVLIHNHYTNYYEGFFDNCAAGTGITFSNNIFRGGYPANSTTSIWINNSHDYWDLNDASRFGAGGSGNIVAADPGLVNYPNTNPNGFYFNFSWDLHLQASSPCKGTGTGGDDMGVYAGLAPMVWSGEPNIPKITKFNLLGS